MERLCNNLNRVVRFVNWRDPIEEGYYPKLDNIVSSRVWPPRQPNARLSVIFKISFTSWIQNNYVYIFFYTYVLYYNRRTSIGKSNESFSTSKIWNVRETVYLTLFILDLFMTYVIPYIVIQQALISVEINAKITTCILTIGVINENSHQILLFYNRLPVCKSN